MRFLNIKDVLLLLALFWGVFFDAIVNNIISVPRFFGVIDDILLFVLFFDHFFIVVKNNKNHDIPFFFKFAFLWSLFVFISYLLSNVEFSRYIYVSRDVYIPFFIFYLIVNSNVRSAYIEKYWKTGVVIIILSSLLMGIYNLSQGTYTVDCAYGVMGKENANMVGYIVAIFGLYVLSKKTNTMMNTCMLIIVLITMILLEAKGAIIATILSFLISAVLGFKKIFVKIISIGCMIVLIIPCIIFFASILNVSWVSNLSVNDFAHKLGSESTIQRGTAAARVLYMYKAIDEVIKSDNITNMFLGYGPGTFISPTGYLFGNKNIESLYNLKYITHRNVVAHSQLSYLLYETGVIGFFLFQSFYLAIFWFFIKKSDSAISTMTLLLILGQPFLFLLSLQPLLNIYWVILSVKYKNTIALNSIE